MNYKRCDRCNATNESPGIKVSDVGFVDAGLVLSAGKEVQFMTRRDLCAKCAGDVVKEITKQNVRRPK